MRTKVWRFSVQLNSASKSQFDVLIPKVPAGSRPLCVMRDTGGEISVWMEVDPLAPLGYLKLLSIGTGHGLVPSNADYLGSVVDGEDVWHVYVPHAQSQESLLGKV